MAQQDSGVSSSIQAIARIGLIVSDLEQACAFYRDALGFRVRSERGWTRDDVEVLTGLEGSSARVAVLSLGGQLIELAAFAPAGAPYPTPRAANDPFFQHFAIAVCDMDAAFARLSSSPQAPISRGGPQRLPPSTGSVTAYKFRDPDGHPLELSYIPGSAWTAPDREGPFVGVDHSALAVADLDASIAFYTGILGFRLVGRGLNQGPEQDRLDGLDGVVLDIVSLQPGDAGAHIELLHYRSPTSELPASRPAPDAIGATRLILQAHSLDELVDRLRRAGAPLVSSGVVTSGDGRRVLVRDPDGHLLELAG